MGHIILWEARNHNQLIMEKMLVFLSLLAHGLTLKVPRLFYVKPTVAPTTECPSGDSPCHSLQYYANHSNFTNNSRFLFLEGEHHLDSVVTISNVTNLSLAGFSSGVEILCKSVPSGFHVETFIEFNIENMAITSCTRSENAYLSLLNGSDVRLKYFNMTGSYVATNVLGTFSTFASTFFSPQGVRIRVDYSLCDKPSYFNFSKSKLHDINIGMHCTGIQVLVEDSTLYSELRVDYSVLTNNSFFVSNSIVTGDIRFSGDTTCFGSQCDISSLQCDAAFLKIMNTTFNANSDITFWTPEHPDTKMCTVLIEDSTFLSATSNFYFAYNDSRHGDPINVEIKNTSFVDTAIKPQFTAIKFDSCMFENYTYHPSIMAIRSKVIFQGNSVFKNNSAPAGAGISLISHSYMYLEPHTHILFEGNHADYVGGAIYTDGLSGDPCFYHVMDSSMHNTVTVDFDGNTAGFGGSSLYGNNALYEGGSLCTNFINIFNTSNTETDPSALASDPHRVCLCDEEKLQPDCSISFYNTSAFPGQIFPVRLAVIGDLFKGVVVGAVRVYPYSINATVGPSSQSYDKPSCGNFNFSVNSTEKLVSFLLGPEQIF